MGNPKHSKWFSTPVEKRVRKPVTVTLSEEARKKLARLCEQHEDGTMSAVVEDLILKEPLR